MSTKQEAVYTVVMNDGWQSNEQGQDDFAGLGLRELIAACAALWPECRLEGWVRGSGHGVGSATMRDTFIKHGQTIERVGGKYVPRNFVETARFPDPVSIMVDSQLRVQNAAPETEPELAALPYFAEQQERARFDSFREFCTTSSSSDPNHYRGSFGSPDLQKAEHQVSPMFGSAFLRD